MTLLPATALADDTADYPSWYAAIASETSLTTNTTIAIDNDNYTYGGDKTGVSESINLTNVKNYTVYKADTSTGTGTGKVLWAPTLQGEGKVAMS